MKLAHKFTLAIVTGITVVLAAKAYVSCRSESARWQRQNRADQRETARLFAAAVTKLWATNSRDAALDVLREADAQTKQGHLRWVWLDADAKPPHRPAVAAREITAGSRGKDVVQFTRPQSDRRGGNLYTYALVTTPGGRRGAVELWRSSGPLEHRIREMVWENIALTIIIAVVCGALAMALGRWLIGRPMDQLAAAARRVGEGDFSCRLDLKQRDELGDLGREFNSMCEQLAKVERDRETAAEQLRHADRLSTVGQIASSIAHELGTPLNVVSGRASMMSTGLIKPEDVAQNAKIIVEQTKRMAAIIRQLLDFARRGRGEIAAVDVREVVRDVFQLLKASARKRNVALVLDAGGDAHTVRADAGKLQQVLANLVVNGIEAMPDGGRLEVSMGREQATAPLDYGGGTRDVLCMRVRDEGQGISERDIPRIFEPFFTTKGAAEGTGLGLSVSDEIIRQHGGWMEVESSVGKGTCFRIYLPLGEEA